MKLLHQRSKDGALFGVAYDSGNGSYLIVKEVDGRLETLAARDFKKDAISLFDQLSLADKMNPAPEKPTGPTLPHGIRGRLSALAERLAS